MFMDVLFSDGAIHIFDALVVDAFVGSSSFHYLLFFFGNFDIDLFDGLIPAGVIEVGDGEPFFAVPDHSVGG